MSKLHAALEFFEEAKAYSTISALQDEVEWQRSRDWHAFCEADLLREGAWVILCTGFRETIVRKSFGYISLAFCDWESAASIVAAASLCRATALAAINNERKIDAIIALADQVNTLGFCDLKYRIIDDPVRELQKLPYIGPITAMHLAKNLGFNCAKQDRHLARLSAALGYTDATELCAAIAFANGEKLSVVDLILWRYIADNVPDFPYSPCR